MSNFSVGKLYTYTSSNLYTYLGANAPTSGKKLEEVFNDFHITPTGKVDDLKKLNNAMYQEYSKQVQNHIANQEQKEVIPWAGLCAQIGLQATGDKEKDAQAFNNAIAQLSQSSFGDGQAMAYFAGLKSEASKFFNSNSNQNIEDKMISYESYQAKFFR